MKRGLLGLIAVVLFLSLPAVRAAETFLELFFGTPNESILFLKIAYAMLVWIIFLKACKETVFKKEQEKLANVFSLLLAFFAFRFTPDWMVQGFGWVIMGAAPFIIFYKLAGIFVKKEKGFSWIKFLLALFATLLTLIALGATGAFSLGLGSIPIGGGFLDEGFADLHYLLFSQLDTFFVAFLAALIIGLLFLLVSRFTGGKGTGEGRGGTFGGSFLRGFLLVLGIALILALLTWLLGGTLGTLAFPLGWLGSLITILYWLGILAAAVFFFWLLYRFPAFRNVVWRVFRFVVYDFWKWLILVVIPWILKKIWVFIGWIGGKIRAGWNLFRNWRRTRPIPTNRDLVLYLRTPTQTIKLSPTKKAPAPISVDPGTTTTFLLNADFWKLMRRNVPLENAQFAVRVSNGTLTPTTGTSDARGVFRAVYTAPTTTGAALLHIDINHPQLHAQTIVPDCRIEIGGEIPKEIEIDVSPVTVDVGNPATISVEVVDFTTRAGVNNARVDILFPRDPGIGPFTGTTLGGSVGSPGICTITTGPFPRAGVYHFVASVLAPGYTSPATVHEAVTVITPTRENLEILNLQATARGSVVNGTPLVSVRIRQQVDIELFVEVPASGSRPARAIDTATITITPNTNVVQPTRRGEGRYLGSFTPDASQIGTQHFVVQASLTGYNDDTAELEIKVKDLPGLNVGITYPSTMRVGDTQSILLHITNATTGAATDATVTVLMNGASFASQRTSRGDLVVSFTPAREGVYSFTVQARELGYQNPPDQTFSLTVLAPTALRITANVFDHTGNPLAWALLPGETATIFVSVTDSSGVALPAGSVALSPPVNLRIPSGLVNSSGIFQTTFTAPVVRTRTSFSYSITLSGIRGYTLPLTPPTVRIDVDSAPGIGVTVDWVPEPSRSNRYMLMNFLVINDVSGVPLLGAEITLRDTHSHSVLFDRNGPYKTNNFGTLSTPLRIELGRTLPRGGTEQHRIEIIGRYGSYTPKTGTVTIMFLPPRSRLGGPRSVTL